MSAYYYKTEVICVECGSKFKARTDMVKKGWGKYCSTKCANRAGIKFLYNNQRLTIRQITNLPECSHPYSTMYFRIVKKNMTVKDAIEAPVKPKPKKYPWKGKDLTIYQIAKDESAKVGNATIQNRIDRGWSIEEAVLTPSGLPPIAQSTKTPESKPSKELAKIFETPVNPDKCRYTKGGWS